MLTETAIAKMNPLDARRIFYPRCYVKGTERFSGNNWRVLERRRLVFASHHDPHRLHSAVFREGGSAAGRVDGFKEIRGSSGKFRRRNRRLVEWPSAVQFGHGETAVRVAVIDAYSGDWRNAGDRRTEL